MFLQAVVIEVQWQRLLVLDLSTRQNVIVNTSLSGQFRPGDIVNIWYSGVMTASIPPQISAISINLVQHGQFPPAPQPPCPPGGCRPVVIPPIFFPPVGRPPFRPPVGRPPHHHPGRPRPR